MNAWLSWRPTEQHAQIVRNLLRRGTRVSHHLFSVVGCFAVAVALALWLLPTVRGTLAAKLMPVVSAAVQAGPARLLSGHPLPNFAPAGAQPQQDDAPETDALAVGLDVAPEAAAQGVQGDASDPARNGPSPVALAKLIPIQRVAADARDDRALASNREQALVATYLSRRYRVAQEPLGQLVKAAFQTGRDVGLDPLLLLSVMAIESGFNPYAESGVGAKGLMQVMSKVHSDKFEYFGGTDTALQPLANLQVGALVLKDCIARGGSLANGLRLYNGSTNPDDNGYGSKVMAERGRLRDVARGRSVPINAPQAPAQPAKPIVTAAAVTAAAGGAKRVHATLDGATTVKAAPKEAAPQDDASVDTAKQSHGDHSELGA
ncbi:MULTISPECIES: lytic transglycosylase domain-containing protein [Burkholderia]|uniref:Lipoprotein n=1 Tax=Burkholderia cenocepacia (strain ATCC BAA-245 / DSM 16553 / LMG 16656 / NCTC 13227 / J2315 / CF5610) TaxID=216591 RepID=B4EBU1_BURCJ|nr:MULTISPECIES: lytic transglycosylase domain-containing protein [Burkholderia]KIS49033.1 transglycosylase SLT domain protein [Burkholderia cepacia]AMU07688.1 transglycosylase SLT domain protein [Burkholderia cenocepacia]ELW9526698.1 lytic transglycosylase domain-containing protein [Burkholderia cenocepacia]EPZ85769.1 transglycosylase SLT domain protein [Burkholderia cenocepacia K56-2Valvano]ERI27965.1 transglycosylase SLT domain protein [Burkholderia cenocepacia BC7]